MIEIVEYYISYREDGECYFVKATRDYRYAEYFVREMNKQCPNQKYEFSSSYESYAERLVLE